MHGLNLSTAGNYLRNRVNGAVASKYREDGDEYDIKVRYAPEFRTSLERRSMLRPRREILMISRELFLQSFHNGTIFKKEYRAISAMMFLPGRPSAMRAS